MVFSVAPPWTRLGKTLESKVRKALFEFTLLQDVEKLTVALSGGKDSLTMLFLLRAILGNGFPNIPLAAVHIDGEFSCGAGVSRSFIEKVCQQCNIPLHVKTATQKRSQLQCYSCSRERRRLLFEAAKEIGSSHIAFGHHRDDAVQTLFMNIYHKAEFCPLLPKVPMHHYGVTIIRPLIYVEEREIKQFATMYRFQRISCRCPVGQTSKRRTAEEILSHIENHFPNARANLFQLGQKHGDKKASLPPKSCR